MVYLKQTKNESLKIPSSWMRHYIYKLYNILSVKNVDNIEANAVAEGFKLSIKMHGLKYNKLIGKI